MIMVGKVQDKMHYNGDCGGSVDDDDARAEVDDEDQRGCGDAEDEDMKLMFKTICKMENGLTRKMVKMMAVMMMAVDLFAGFHLSSRFRTLLVYGGCRTVAALQWLFERHHLELREVIAAQFLSLHSEKKRREKVGRMQETQAEEFLEQLGTAK